MMIDNPVIDETVDADELMRYLKISKPTLDRWVKNGVICKPITPPKHNRVWNLKEVINSLKNTASS